MSADRHRARILAVQALCQLDVQGDEFLARIPAFLADAEGDEDTVAYAWRLIEWAWRRRDPMAQEISGHMASWSMDRLTPVDRNVLRTALVELETDAVPPKVAINEAIEIADEFGSAESKGFVNGVLDALWKARRGHDGNHGTV